MSTHDDHGEHRTSGRDETNTTGDGGSHRSAGTNHASHEVRRTRAGMLIGFRRHSPDSHPPAGVT